MARTIETLGPQGATLTCKLFAVGSDTAVETISLTEATNRKGIFTGTIASATGWHRVVVLNGTTNVGDFVINALATDATTYQAVVDSAADVRAINSVSTSSVTTVNANIGTTQPVNFTGTGATAYIKANMLLWAGNEVTTIPVEAF